VKLLFENWRQYINEGEEDFKPHTMYNPDTDEKEEATTKKRHDELKEEGWGHEKPQLDEEECWDGYKADGKKPSPSGKETQSGNPKMVNDCKPIKEEEFYEVAALDENEEYCPACRKLQEVASGELMFDPSIGTAMQKQLDKLERERKEKRKRERAENRIQNLKDNPSLKLALKKSRDEESYFSLEEKKKRKKPCKPSKGKRFAKRVDGKCRSFGQAGKAKSGGDRIRPGTKKGDAYCARSAGIKKCKNPPCANTLSRKKWKCRGKKSVAEQVEETYGNEQSTGPGLRIGVAAATQYIDES